MSEMRSRNDGRKVQRLWEPTGMQDGARVMMGRVTSRPTRVRVDSLLKDRYVPKEGKYLGSPKAPRGKNGLGTLPEARTADDLIFRNLVVTYGKNHPKVVAIAKAIGITLGVVVSAVLAGTIKSWCGSNES